jgi:hypothetical protein
MRQSKPIPSGGGGGGGGGGSSSSRAKAVRTQLVAPDLRGPAKGIGAAATDGGAENRDSDSNDAHSVDCSDSGLPISEPARVALPHAGSTEGDATAQAPTEEAAEASATIDAAERNHPREWRVGPPPASKNATTPASSPGAAGQTLPGPLAGLVEQPERAAMIAALEREQVTVVRDAAGVLALLEQLESLPLDTFVACDTEVMNFNADMPPLNNGRVTCLSLYAGPEHDFGNGPCVWVDDLDDAWGCVAALKPWLEDPKRLKIWHNYSFDRHVLYNWPCSLDVQGLGGDTMHMARLWDTARSKSKGMGGYSLAALTSSLLKHRNGAESDSSQRAKLTMKQLFGMLKLKKDGTPGKQIVVPPVEQLQRQPQWRRDWIEYSVQDAKLTWELHRVLRDKLVAMPWASRPADSNGNTTAAGGEPAELNMYDFYETYIVPFAECLTDIEREGITVDSDQLARSERRAIIERAEAEATFRAWATAPAPPHGIGAGCEDGNLVNLSSGTQMQALLFAPAANAKPKSGVEPLPPTRVFDIDNVDGYIEEGREAKPPKKKRPITIVGQGLPAIKFTAGGWPSVNGDSLSALAGKDPTAEKPRYGTAYPFFRDKTFRALASEAGDSLTPELEERLGETAEEAGAAACKAINALTQVSSIDTMLSNFILPLQVCAKRPSTANRASVAFLTCPLSAPPPYSCCSDNGCSWRRSCAQLAEFEHGDRTSVCPAT